MNESRVGHDSRVNAVGHPLSTFYQACISSRKHESFHEVVRRNKNNRSLADITFIQMHCL